MKLGWSNVNDNTAVSLPQYTIIDVDQIFGSVASESQKCQLVENVTTPSAFGAPIWGDPIRISSRSLAAEN